MTAQADVSLFAVLQDGLQPLEVPADADHIHDALDDMPLGVYTAFRTFRHEHFLRLADHLQRTETSMELFGLEGGLDRALVRRSIQAAAEKSPHADSVLRLDVLAEPPARLPGVGRILLGVSELVPVPESILRDGVPVRTTRDLHRSQPRVKYARFVIERRPFPVGAPEAFEHVMLGPTEELLEGTTSNFHAVLRGELRSARSGVLEGITRKTLIDLCHQRALPFSSTPVRLAELPELEEAFLTSSTRGVLPVVSVDGHSIGAGVPGPITRELMTDYSAYAEANARRAWPLD